MIMTSINVFKMTNNCTFTWLRTAKEHKQENI